MMHSVESERAKYDHEWTLPHYRVKNHGLDLYRERRELFPPWFPTAIDFGSGTGRLVRQWIREGINARGIDISPNAADVDVRDKILIAPLWHFNVLERVHVGVCADVMEHIPPEYVRRVMACIGLACHMCVFKIANFPSSDDDRILHLTLHDAAWWHRELSNWGIVEEIPHATAVDEFIFRVSFPR